MADITSIDALVPDDNERIRLGAQRIRETRTKLNEVITKVNELANVPTASQEVYSRIQNIYVVDATQATTITIPAGITTMEIVGCGGGGGGGWARDSSNVQQGYPIRGGAGGSGNGNYATLAVSEGEQYIVTLGTGGLAGLSQDGATDGSYTRIVKVSDSSVVFEAPGGTKGGYAYYDGDHGTAGTSGAIGTYVPAKSATYEQMCDILAVPVASGGTGGDSTKIYINPGAGYQYSHKDATAGSQGIVAITLRG